MRRRLTLLGVALAVASVLAVPVLAAGGEGTQAVDVCWMQGNTEVRAKFVTTRSGIVQQFRYEPDDRHGVFMPKEKFPNEPDEGDWFSWTAHSYAPCDPGTEYEVMDLLVPGTQYWVQLEVQE